MQFEKLPGKHREVLEFVAGRLNQKDINWILTGSVSHLIQGVDVKPHDIDIYTTKEGLYKTEDVLEAYCVESVHEEEMMWDKEREKTRGPVKVRTYIGKFEVKGVKVEAMTDLRKYIDGEWKKDEVKIGRWGEMNSIKVPLSDLRNDLRAYRELGRTEKVKKIKKALER